MKRRDIVLLAACLLLICLTVAAGPVPAGYHLIKKVSLGAAPGGGEYFDYITVDPNARRLYLSHGTEVQVLDADKFTVLGTITGGLKRDHGIALVPDAGHGFITDGETGQVTIFDLKTLKTLGQIKAENDADFILYDPASNHIFTFNGSSKNSTVIDPEKGTVVATIPLGGAPEQAVADGKGTIYDNLEDTNEVIAIDSRELKVKSRWPVAPAGQPVSIAMDRKNQRLFVAGRNPKMLVMLDAA